MAKIIGLIVISLCLAAPAWAQSEKLLFDLASSGTADEIKALVSRQNFSQCELNYALHKAVGANPSVDVLETLIAAGADTQSGFTWHEMEYGLNAPVPEEALPDVDFSPSGPLWHLGDDELDKMELLLKHGADPNERDFEGGSILYYEVWGAQEPSKRLELLLRYADPNARICGPACPRSGYIDDKRLVQDYNIPCLALEFALDNADTVRLLLEAGAKSNYLIYQKAKDAKKLPADLIKRLDPARNPDGSVKTIEGLLSLAIKQAAERKYNEANETLDDLYFSFKLPKSTLAAVWYLRSLCSDDDLDSAKKALDLEPSQVRHHRQYVSALIYEANYAEALKALRTALKRFPKDRRLYLYQAVAYGYSGNISKAQDYIAKALSAGDDPQTYFRRGEIYLMAGKEDKAEADFRKALEMGQQANARLSLLYLAGIKERQGDIDSALNLASKAENYPDRPKLTWSNQSIRDGQQVILPASLVGKVRRNFEIERANIVRCSAAGCRGDASKQSPTFDCRENAVGDLKNWIQETSLRHEAAAFHYLLSFCAKESAQQLKHIDEAIKGSPTEYAYFYRRGELYRENGQDAQALADFIKAMDLGQLNKAHQNLLYQADLRFKQGDKEAALKLAEKALLNYARSPADKEQMQAAIRALQEAMSPLDYAPSAENTPNSGYVPIVVEPETEPAPKPLPEPKAESEDQRLDNNPPLYIVPLPPYIKPDTEKVKSQEQLILELELLDLNF